MDREDIDPASDWLAGRPDPPRQHGGVGANVPWAVLFEHSREAIEELLSLVAQRFPPDRYRPGIRGGVVSPDYGGSAR
jgi:hypothetical protein